MRKNETGKTELGNPLMRLRNCTDVGAVDSLLTDIGLVPDLGKRILFLHGIMGVEQVFFANELTDNEKYAVAKEELVSHIWK